MTLNTFFKDLKRNWLLSAILAVVIGIVLMIFPTFFTHVACFVMGALLMIFGVTRLVRYFRQSDIYADLFRADLMVGLFSVGIGVLMILRAEVVVSLIPIIFGILLISCGIAGVQRAVDAKNIGYNRWGILLALALLTAALGVLLLINPFASIEITVIVIGACLIYEGISDIVALILVGKRIDAWRKQHQT